MNYPRYKDLGAVALDDLIAMAQDVGHDNSPAMNEIVRRFEGFTQKVARSIKTSGHLRDDLANAARYGLVRAVRRHDGRPGFPALAGIYMRGAALREHGRWIIPETADTEAVDRIRSKRLGSDPISNLMDLTAPWGDGAVATAITELTTEQRNIAELRYIDDEPIKAIATLVGTSGPAVSQRLRTIQRTVEHALAA